MLVNFNSSFNRPNYNQYYSGYSHAFQRDNYKCKFIPSNKPDNKLEGNQGFLNAGNKTLHDWGFAGVKLPDFDDICGPGRTDFCDPIPPIIYPCERDFPKVENCIVFQCNQSGVCFDSGFLGPQLPWYLDPFWDIFIEDPFFNLYQPPTCTPIEGVPCKDPCKSEKPRITSSDVFNAIYEASQKLDNRKCYRVLNITFIIKGDVFTENNYKSELVIKYGEDPPIRVRPADPGDLGCTDDCTPPWTGPEAAVYYTVTEPYPCGPIEVITSGKSCTTLGVGGYIFYLEQPDIEKTVQGFEVVLSRIATYYPWDGTFYTDIPELAKDACSVRVTIITLGCESPGGLQQPVTVTINRGGRKLPPPVYEPPQQKPKENPPECMQCCTCEEIQSLLERQKAQIIECLGFQPCDDAQKNKDLITNLEVLLNEYFSARRKISDNLFDYYVDCCDNSNVKQLEKQLKELDKKLKQLDDKLDGFNTILHKLNTIEDILENLGGSINTFLEKVLECCDNIERRLDTLMRIEEILLRLPQDVALELSPEFEVLLAKVNEILSKLGGEDNLFSKIVEILTLLATLLGLLTDIRSLLANNKDYSPDLDALKQLAQEIKQLLGSSVQGSVDSIRCDGTISSNSWSGQGIDGLNQAITALGVNLAILHADLCGVVQEQIKPPQLKGSVDALRCDGEIISSSWDGEGFDGLNQAITALGVNLAILHADLCELIETSGLKTSLFQLSDEYKCGDENIRVIERIEDSPISKELMFLYERLKRIETLICDQDDCNAVPVFPGDTIEEREIPAQAVITFVESRFYPKLNGSTWHISIPYPNADLISQDNCWSKFQDLTIRKGEVYGRIVWQSPNDTINRFITGIYGNSERETKQFLERIATFSSLQVKSIRLSTGGNPRARPRDVTIQAVKVVILERDSQGRMVPTKCCRAPKTPKL